MFQSMLQFASVCVCAYRNNHDVVLQEDFVSIWGGGTIGTLSNDLEETKNKQTHTSHDCDQVALPLLV